MDYDYFHNLTPEDAREYLQHYLEEVGRGTKGLVDEAAAAGVVVDCSLESIPGLLRYVLARLETIPVSDDPELPWWIRATPEHQTSLFEWTEDSGILVLRASYYFGESFVSSRDGLGWDIGSANSIEFHQPVVAGFPNGVELAPILVTDNLLRRVVKKPERSGDFEIAVETWRSGMG